MTLLRTPIWRWLLRLGAYGLFWLWNVVALAFSCVLLLLSLSWMLSPVPTVEGPERLLADALVLTAIPVGAVILGTTVLRRSPGRLFALGYGVEVPLTLLVGLHLFGVRELAPASLVLLTLAGLALLAYLWQLLDRNIDARGPWLQHLRGIGLTLLLVTGLCAAAWIAFYAVALAAWEMSALAGRLGFSSTGFADLGFPLLFFTTNWLVVMPIAMPILYAHAWWCGERRLAAVSGRPRALALTAAICVVSGLLVAVNLPQAQRQVASLLPTWPLSPFGPPPPLSYAVSLDDLDGDGDVDAVVGNGPSNSDWGTGNSDDSETPNSIWLNDGSGHFTNTGQRLVGNHETRWDRTDAVALGDLDGDGDADVIFGNAVYSPDTGWINTQANSRHDLQSPNMVWLNDGAGHFELLGEYLMQPNGESDYNVSQAVALGDLDGDGDLDVYVANCCRTEWGSHNGTDEPTTDGHTNAYNMVWLNDGHGQFTDSGQRLGNSATGAVALGDLDGDGDLDAFEVNLGGRSEDIDSAPSDMVWLNDGAGHFADSQQRLGNADGHAVALGDLDGDGDLDAFVGNAYYGRADEVWLNDGAGNFTDSGQRLGDENARLVVLDDVDRDGDLDAFVGNESFGQILTNDGSGHFAVSDRRFEWVWEYAVNLADVDGDGDQDVFAIRFNGDYLVWRNDGLGNFTFTAP